MENIMVFAISFSMIFLVYLVIYFVKSFKGTLPYMKEFDYLRARYKINRANINYNNVAFIIILLNSFIIAATGTLCTMIKLGYIWQLCIGFALLMILIYVIYGILGRILKKKDLKNNVMKDYQEVKERNNDKNGNDKHRKNRKKVAR